MGFIEDKSKIVQQVGLFEVLSDLPKSRFISNIPSVKSTSKNLIPFLLDLLSTTCKDKEALPNLKDRVKCDLIRIVTEILVDFFPVFVRIIKEGFIKAIKAGLICPADFKIPIPTPSVILPQKGFDLNKLTTLDPTAFPTSLFFGETDDDLNLFLANLVRNGVGSTGVWKNILDFEVIDYPLPQTNPLLPIVSDLGLRVTINSSYGGKEYDVFLKDYMNNLELFNFKNFVPNLLEEFNGMISNIINNSDVTLNAPNINLSTPEVSFNLDIEAATKKEQVNKMIEKILDTDPCEQNFSLDDNFFQFSSDELLDIEAKAQNRLIGSKITNYSCTPTLVNLTIDNNTYENFKESLKNNPSQSVLITKQFTENILTQASQQIGGTPNTPPQGLGFGFDANINFNLNNSFSVESIKKSISFDLALALPKLSTNLAFTPKIMVLYQTSKKLITNTVNEYKDSFDFAKANKVFFEYVVRESGAALLKILYDQIKEEVLKIVQKLATTLIKEAITKKINQLKSLTSGYTNKAGLSSVDVPDVSQFV